MNNYIEGTQVDFQIKKVASLGHILEYALLCDGLLSATPLRTSTDIQTVTTRTVRYYAKKVRRRFDDECDWLFIKEGDEELWEELSGLKRVEIAQEKNLAFWEGYEAHHRLIKKMSWWGKLKYLLSKDGATMNQQSSRDSCRTLLAQ